MLKILRLFVHTNGNYRNLISCEIASISFIEEPESFLGEEPP